MDGRLFVFGGVDDSGTPLGTGGVYDPYHDRWEVRPELGGGTAVLSARSGHSVVVIGDEVLIWGGCEAGGGLLDSGAVYRP